MGQAGFGNQLAAMNVGVLNELSNLLRLQREIAQRNHPLVKERNNFCITRAISIPRKEKDLHELFQAILSEEVNDGSILLVRPNFLQSSNSV